MSVARRPPYLPFLAGPAVFAVGLKPIAVDAWIDPDTEVHALAEKRGLVAARRDDVFAQIAGSEAGQEEAAALIAASRGLEPLPFVETGLALSDDLCVMEMREGAWRLAAALLCAPSFWSLRENIGGPLAHLHGPVPDRLGPEGTQGLANRIGRMFSALPADQILERFNWTIQAGPERFTPSSAPLLARAARAKREDAADLLHLRVERQTIRRLPRTGGVLFTIRVCIDPLRAVFAVEGGKEAFARAWAQTPDHVRAYKHWAPMEHLVRALLAT